jgi:predicted ATPase
MPGDCFYIIDEYENSLGINAIDFLPNFIIEYGANNQFFIATHHPYLINNMPVRNWLVFNRTGSDVFITRGSEERYGKSKQQSFIKLINDPLYLEGLK